jgi:regulator of sigma E protease
VGLLNGAVDILLVLFILVVLVVIHEFGHFATARWAGVRVHEFGIGFPPRARIFARDRETIYTLNWLPIGGFVRLEGEEGESDDPRSFVRQPLRVCLVILLAGVAMNLLLAFVIFSLIAGLADPVANIRVGAVQPDGPAAEAGLRGGQQVGETPRGEPIYDETGDLIVAIDGRRFPIFDRVDAADAPLRYLREHAGSTVSLTLREPDGTERIVQATLRPAEPDGSPPNEGALGIYLQGLPRDEIQRDPLSAVAVGAARTLDASTLILRGLAELITNLTNPQVSGPIGIVTTVGLVRTELPPIFLVWFIGLLSANLGVVNALPFPPMDGGRIAVSLVQRVSGNRISTATERLVYLAGFILLMALIVWISYFDIQRLGGT